MENNNSNNNSKKIIYAIYARKSSEAEDRQALSIESQIGEDKKIVQQRSIIVPGNLVLSESKSAKSPYKRPVFEQLIKDIEKGKVKGIIAWHPNRLSRNAIDAARLIDLFDRELLQEIITSQQTFRNMPSDKFFFTMLCGQAKMENDNKSLDVKRGLREKCEMGYPPQVSMVGYKNEGEEKGKKYLVADPERFNLARQLLETYLRNEMSVPELVRYADKVLGLKTIPRKREGGHAISISGMHTFLREPFHAGFFYAKNQEGELIRYQANESVPRMITETEYWQIQEKLGKKGRPRPSKHVSGFAYKKYATCGGCKGQVTAHYKHQLICSECKHKFSYRNKEQCPKCHIAIKKMKKPKYLEYIYYECVRRCAKRKNPQATSKVIGESEIDRQVAAYFENNLQISSALRDWCLEHLDEPRESDRQDEFAIRSSWERQLQEKKKELDELKLMRARRMIETDEELGRLQSPVKEEIRRIEGILANNGDKGAPESLERVKQGFNLAVGIAEVFRNGTFEEKQEALQESSSNLTIIGKITTISEGKELKIIKNMLLSVKKENPSFEPKNWSNSPNKTSKNGAFDPVSDELLPLYDAFRTVNWELMIIEMNSFSFLA